VASQGAASSPASASASAWTWTGAPASLPVASPAASLASPGSSVLVPHHPRAASLARAAAVTAASHPHARVLSQAPAVQTPRLHPALTPPAYARNNHSTLMGKSASVSSAVKRHLLMMSASSTTQVDAARMPLARVQRIIA